MTALPICLKGRDTRPDRAVTIGPRLSRCPASGREVQNVNLPTLQAPFPFFGGKAVVADRVWQALGAREVHHYIEPCFGSGAVLLARPYFDPTSQVETVNDSDGFLCLGPETRVLTTNLTWVAIGSCKPGDQLLAFDEFNSGPRFKKAPSGYRHWRIATVLKTKIVNLPSYRLTFSDGTKITCSENHLWLGGRNRGLRWLTTQNWHSTIPRKNQKAWVLKIVPVIEKENNYESGWLGGFADGEGHYHGSAHGGGGSWAISLHQAKGPIIEYAYKLLLARQYNLRQEIRRKNPAHKEMVSIHINGGMAESLRFLMSCRPERLIQNVIKGIEKKSIYTRKKQYVFVEEMEYIGLKEVVALETDTNTYIAEGLASHNCNVWRALQAAPDEVARWCDRPVNHADLTARKAALIKNEGKLLENLVADPEWFDAKLAGYWIWAASCWIGSGLTSLGARPHIGRGGEGVHAMGKIPHIGHGGKGVHAMGQIPQTENAKAGVQEPYNTNIYAWFRALSERLRYVRVVCGDWTRVCGGNWQDKMGLCGIFFDPPYGVENRDRNVYHHDSTSIAKAVQEWAMSRGDSPNYRIVLAGYYEEHLALLEHGWRVEQWTAQGGYSHLSGENEDSPGRRNRFREALFFSPHCLDAEQGQQLEMEFSQETTQ